MNEYFVMLNTQKGGVTPLTDVDDHIAIFNDLYSAIESAKSTALGENFGFEVFERGMGEY